MQLHRRTEVAVVVVMMLMLGGCSSVAVVGQPSATPTRSASSALYSLTSSELAPCSQPPVVDRMRAALASNEITSENSELAIPDDPAVVAQGKAAVEQQEKAWRGLSPADRLYQLCLKAYEDGQLPPIAGAPQVGG
jgi:uncharacterized protein YceK